VAKVSLQPLAVLWIPSLLRRSWWPAAGGGKLRGRAVAAGKAEDAHEQIFILSDSSRVLALALRTVEGKPRARGSPFNFRLSALVLIVILTRLCLCFRLAGAAVVSICLLDGGAGAQGKLDARYVATLAGVPIGEGAWVIDIGENQFTAAASGMTTGLLRVFAAGQGNAVSRGAVRGGAPVPTLFVATINHDKWVEEVRIVLRAGTVKELAVDPPNMPNLDRIPVTDVYRRGVIDPLSAALIRISGGGDPVSPEACRRTVPIFDGRMRFDLQLSFRRIEKVHAQTGYQGPVVVCGVQFVPLAGYVPERLAIKWLIAQQDMEIWLAPIPGTRIVVPYRISLPTPLGQGVLEATEFVAAAGPRSTPASR
jgi:Protein of unknown function (DUF3108)